MMTEHDWPEILARCRQLLADLERYRPISLASKRPSHYVAAVANQLGNSISGIINRFTYDPRDGFNVTAGEVSKMLYDAYQHQPTKLIAALRLWEFCFERLAPRLSDSEPEFIVVNDCPSAVAISSWVIVPVVYQCPPGAKRNASELEDQIQLSTAHFVVFSEAIEQLAEAVDAPAVGTPIHECAAPVEESFVPNDHQLEIVSALNRKALTKKELEADLGVDGGPPPAAAWPSLLGSQLALKLDVSQKLVSNYAKEAGVDRPGVGQRDCPYTPAAQLDILEKMAQLASPKNAKRAAELRLEIETKSKSNGKMEN
ncbi:MAG: hypothetical protein H0T51_25430 [Pirellulales bacterium]|nr:hypothetical protein [Pirellulales bacterium]